MPTFNLDSIIQEERELDEQGVGRPFRFGYVFDVDYVMEHGRWQEALDKNIWTIRFKSNGAYNLNFEFTDLQLINQAELYVYNSVGTVVDGPITSKDNATDRFRHIGSYLVAGEEVIIQIIEPKASNHSAMKITKVVHGFVNHYKDILPNNDKKSDNFQSGGVILGCHNDVMCHPAFENLSRGVAYILTSTGQCSGALLNNTMGTNRPYILSAFHCADSDRNGVLSSTEKAATESWSCVFNYKTNSCNGTATPYYSLQRYNNTHFRATWQPTDFLLLELKESIKDPNVRFLGWDITGHYHYKPIGIHHPNGNPMKISFDNHLALPYSSSFTYPRPNNNAVFPANLFYKIGYDNGTMEGGSSGSPLFGAWGSDPAYGNDMEYRVIGQLYGGESACPPATTYGLYGIFAKS